MNDPNGEPISLVQGAIGKDTACYRTLSRKEKEEYSSTILKFVKKTPDANLINKSSIIYLYPNTPR